MAPIIGLQHSPERAATQSPGLAALFAAYPGNRGGCAVNPEGVAHWRNPYRVDLESIPIPRVVRQKTPLNPGLCDEAPFGASIQNAYRILAYRMNKGQEGFLRPYQASFS